MNKNLNRILSVLLLAAAGLVAVFAWSRLPDSVIVQVGLDGQPTNTMPKLAAVGLPLAISAAGSVMNLTGKDVPDKKGLVLAVVGIAVLVLSLFFNR